MATESTLRNMVVTLVLITFLSSIAVAGVYLLTKDDIEATRLAKVNNSIKEVVPACDNAPFEERFEYQGMELYPAKQQGKLIGMAVQVKNGQGYSGDIVLMVGFTSEGLINGVSVLAQNETPGLGAKMADKQKEGGKPVFTTQFLGKDPKNFKLQVSKDGGNVDAITASTISSRAFCEAVQQAYNAFVSYKATQQIEGQSGLEE